MKSGGWQAILDFMHPQLCARGSTVLKHSRLIHLQRHLQPNVVKNSVSTPRSLRRLPGLSPVGKFAVRLVSCGIYWVFHNQLRCMNTSCNTPGVTISFACNDSFMVTSIVYPKSLQGLMHMLRLQKNVSTGCCVLLLSSSPGVLKIRMMASSIQIPKNVITIFSAVTY